MGEKKKCRIVATGAALPEKKLTNHDMEDIVETDNEWIVSRTGIQERRIMEEGKGASRLAEEACWQALNSAGVSPEEIDLIVFTTVTPDQLIPASASILQARLGASRAAAFDLNAGCTGFVYGLATGSQFIETGLYRNVLVIGADLLSRVTDWQDRSTCILFGDGAGVALLQPEENKEEKSSGFLSMELGSDGSNPEILIMPGGGSLVPATEESVRNRMHYIKMNGNEVFKFATRVIPEVTWSLLKKAGRETPELKYLILHQANMRIMESARKKLELSRERVPTNIERYGNMSAASVPVLLHEIVEAGGLNKGDLVGMVGFGAGLTWGGVLLEW